MLTPANREDAVESPAALVSRSEEMRETPTEDQVDLFGVQTVPLTTTTGKVVELTVPSAVAARIATAQDKGARVWITANLSFTGRDFERVDRIHERFAKGERAYLVYAAYGAKPRAQPAVPPRRPSEQGESCFLSGEDARAILRAQRLVSMERGTSVELETGATLRYLTESIPHPWRLRGTVSQVAATLHAARLRRKSKVGPGRGWYQYAAVFVEPDVDGSHRMQATNRPAYAQKIVRRLVYNNFSALVVEGIFRHGVHRLGHEAYLKLAAEQEARSG